MDKGYRILKLKDLVKQLRLPSSKSFKTTEYLTYVIEAIEDAGFRFVQVLQLVDVLYVIVQKVPQEEYIPVKYTSQTKKTPTRAKVEPEIREEFKIEAPKTKSVPEKKEISIEIEQVDLKKSMDKPKLPWQK